MPTNMLITNEYILHELVQHLDQTSLRELRRTCSQVEHILSTNSLFVKKVFRTAIVGRLEINHGYVSYDTKYLRQFIFLHERDAQERYTFAKILISTSQRTKHCWQHTQGHADNQSAVKALSEIQEVITDNCEKFKQIHTLDKQFQKLDAGIRTVNMHDHLLDIYLSISDAEEDLKQIIKEKEQHKLNTNRKPHDEDNEVERNLRSYHLRHLTMYSVHILVYLLIHLERIQKKHLAKLKVRN